MHATELGRWTRFAGKGGIGKCTAIQDCVAESPEHLMFLEGDDIVVLMQLQEKTDTYLGYCEGVVGRFEGSYVRFHSKLKKPVVAKRSSAVPSPVSSAPPSPVVSPQVVSPSPHDNDVSQPRSTVASIERDSTSHSLNSTLDDDYLAPPLTSYSSSSSAAGSVPTTPADFDAPPDTKQHPQDDPLALADESLLYPSNDPDNSFDPSEPSTRISVATFDGMEGIGLSLLQNFMGAGGDDSSSESSSRSNNQTPEPRPPDSPGSTVEAVGLDYESALPATSPPEPVMPAAVDRSDAGSQISSQSEYTGDEWEGASDIYDNYRYSRLSMASKMSRYSKGSMQTPPPIPTDLRRPSVDSMMSQARRPAPLDPSEPSPLLHTSFGSPPTSPTDISVTSVVSHPGDGATIHDRLEMSRAQPMIIQTHLTPQPEAQIVVKDNDDTAGEGPIANVGNPDPESPLSPEDRRNESLIEEKKQVEETSSTFVIMNDIPPPPYSPSAVASSSQHQEPASRNASLMTSPERLPLGSLPAARPRPRPQQPNPGLDFGSSRTSMFLPHPGAPKAPGTAPSGPLYGRVQQQNSRPPPPGNPFGPTSLFHLLRMAGTVWHYPNGAPRQLTLYGMCDIDLVNSIGPVPITFSLEPPMAVPANRLPTRSQTMSPHVHRVGSPPSQKSQHPSGLVGDPTEVTGWNSHLGPTSPPTNPIPRANFFPQKPISRPRSRSLSSFDSSLPDLAGTKETDSSSTNPSTPAVVSGPRSADTNADLRNSSLLNRPGHQPPSIPLALNSVRGPTPPVSPKPRSPSSPLSKSFSPPSSAQSYTPSPLASRFGINGSPSPQPLRQATSTISLRSSTNQSTPLPHAPNVVPPSAPTSRPLILRSNSGPGGSTSFHASNDQPLTPLSSISHHTSDSVSPSLDEPRQSTSSSLSENARLNIPRSAVTVTELAAQPKGLEVRTSVDTDISHPSSEARSASVVSPTPTTTSLSSAHPVASPAVTKNLSLRSKLSISAIRGKSGGGRTGSQDDATIPIDEEDRSFETVQVEDMDFELIKPNLQRMLTPQPSMDSLGARARDNGNQHSPVKPDGGNFLRADSPAVSMVSSRSPAVSDCEVLSPFRNSPMSSLSTTSLSNDSMSSTEVQAHRHRELKWVSLMSSLPPAQAKKSKKVKRLLLDGVPASVRYQVWAHLADCKGKRMNGLYPQLVKRGKVPASPTIERDVEECFGDQPQSKDGSVVSVLQAYLNMVPDIQYHRGLTSIVGRLLAQAPEEDAFWIFISMMDAYLRPYFASNAVQMEVDASLFAKAVEANDSALAKRVFVDMAVHPAQLCRSWFISLFFDALPVEYHLRVWDVFLFEGIPFLFRIGLALFSCCRRALLESQGQDHVVSVLSRIPLPCLPSTPDALVELAMSMKLKDDDIRKHRSKMEAQLKRQTQSRVAKSSTNGGVAPISLPRS